MKKAIRVAVVFVFLLIIGSVKGQTPTWSADVAPIVYSKCTSCHHAGAIAPFVIESYSDFSSNAAHILDNVLSRKMPPWPPDPAYRRLAHERLLSVAEIQKIQAFVVGGMPTGDLATAPSVPVYSNTSQVGIPDTIINTPAYSVGMSTDEYRCFAIPSGFTQQKKIKCLEFIPGNQAIVHHVLVFWDTTGTCANLDAADPAPGYVSFGGVGTPNANLIGAWVPGSSPFVLPDAFAFQIPANADIVLQFHYAPGSLGLTDASHMNVFYNTAGFSRPMYFSPALNHSSNMTDGPLMIPANTTRSFHETYTINAGADLALLGVAPHMHWVGKSISACGVTPSGDTIPFVDIPDWKFEWQGAYQFRNVIRVPDGTRLLSTAFYDNTTANFNNPTNPPGNVYAGEGTGDEMMITFFEFSVYMNGDENISLDTSPLVDLTGIVNPVPAPDFDFMLGPNPAESLLVSHFYLAKPRRLTMFASDMLGKKVKIFFDEKDFLAGDFQYQYSVSGLPSGCYFITLSDGLKQSVKKLVITN